MKLLFATAILGLLTGLGHVVPRHLLVVAGVAVNALMADSTTVRVLSGAESPDLDEMLGYVLHIEKHLLVLHDR
jgi:hypothetical protein